MKRYLLLLFLPGLMSLQAQKPWTLEECLDYARTHNLNILQSELDIGIKEQAYKEAKYAVLPSLQIGSSGMWNYGLTQNLTTGILENQTVFGNNIRISSEMPLFQGLYWKNNRQAAYLNKLLAEYTRDSQIKKISTQIVQSYLQVLMDKEALAAAEAQWQAGLEQQRKMRELVDAGVRPQSDLKDLEAQSARDYLEYVRIKNRLKLDKMQLAQLLELDDPASFEINGEQPVRVNEKLLLQSAEELFRQYYPQTVENRMAKTRMAMGEKQIRLARSGLYPSVSLFLSWNSRYMDREKITGVEIDPDNPYRVIGITEQSHENVLAPNFRYITGPPDPYWDQIRQNQGTAVGFSINIPLFNRFRTRLKIREAGLQQEKNKLANRQQSNEFRYQVEQLHADILNAKEKQKAALKSKEAAETAYRYAMEKLNAGLLSPYDLENARSRKMRAEADYLSAKYEYLLKLKLLELLLQAD